MENRIDLLRKLGFSDAYLKCIDEETQQLPNNNGQSTPLVFDLISVDSSEIIYPIIEKTEAPVNSYVN
jgi:hypothetical protein